MVYKIIFEIKTPIISLTPIHFDSVLSAVHPAMHGGSGITRRSSTLPKAAPLPLDSVKIDKSWVWCCSTAEYSDNAKIYTDRFTRRTSGIDYNYLSGVRTPRYGTNKDRCESIYGVVCDNISFLASLNDLKELKRLCKRVKSIGALRKMGYGEVINYNIVPTELGWKSCIWDSKKMMFRRNLPQPMIKDKCYRKVPVHHPYWLSCGHEFGAFAGDNGFVNEEVYLNVHK